MLIWCHLSQVSCRVPVRGRPQGQRVPRSRRLQERIRAGKPGLAAYPPHPVGPRPQLLRFLLRDPQLAGTRVQLGQGGEFSFPLLFGFPVLKRFAPRQVSAIRGNRMHMHIIRVLMRSIS